MKHFVSKKEKTGYSLKLIAICIMCMYGKIWEPHLCSGSPPPFKQKNVPFSGQILEH